MSLIVWLIGWPGIILSLSLLSLGLAKKWPRVMLAGALISLPFLVYLIGSPRFQYWSPIVVALTFAAVVALYNGRRGLSVLLVVPYTFLVLWLAYAVSAQDAQFEDSRYEEMQRPIAPNGAQGRTASPERR